MLAAGTWSLHVDASGVATAAKADGEAEIRVGVAGLASMWTGALSATQLRDYGLLHSRDDACAFPLFHFSASPLSSRARRALADAGAVLGRALVKAQLMFAMPKAAFTGEFGW